MTATIPAPLIHAGARFVLVKPHDKAAFEPEWATRTYDSSSPQLLSHLKNGGNYGVLTHNGICIIDIDNPEEFRKLNPNIPDTFMVRRGSSGRGHIYFTCPDCPEEFRKKIETPFGDVRLGGNFYVVGASCTHPSGDAYEIIKNVPISDISWNEINRLIQTKPPGRITERQFALPDVIRETTERQFNLPDVIRETNPGRNQTLYRYGCQLRALGRDDGEISLLVRDANQNRCKPSPLLEDEISTLIRSVIQHTMGNIVLPERSFPKKEPEEIGIVDYELPDGCLIVTTNKAGMTITRINCSIYSDFLTNLLSIKYFNKILYIYDHGNHYYRPQTNEIETHVRNTVIKFGVSDKLQLILAEIKTHLTSMGCYIEYPFNTDTNKIPVENGIVRINYSDETIEILPHSPEHLFTYKLSVRYDPSKKNCMVIPLLKRLVELKDIITLVQIPAQAILQMQTANSYKKAYLLQGEPHAGKTSYLKLLYRLFGDDFTTAISLQQLCDNHFVGGALEGKLLNIYDDLEDVALNTIDQFKTLTGDCRHGIERKYESIYTGKITAVHIFTCNYPPGYPAKVKRDAAFWARWEYLKFPFAYTVNPNFYSEWYTDDMISAFLNLILSIMIHIKKHGLVSNSDVQDVMMSWSVNSDHLYNFIESIFEPYEGKRPVLFNKIKLHNAYLKWCMENKIPEHKQHQSLRKFTVALQAHDIIPTQTRVGRDRYEVYSTLSYIQKPNSDDLNVISSIS
jgi:phage/plasmid-associated DNA primase